MTAGSAEKYKVEKQNLFSFLLLSPLSSPTPLFPSLSLSLSEPIKCQLLFSSSKVLARCQQTLLKLCHCKLKACKSLCQWHAIRLGIYNKKCDAVIKGMASLPSIYNVNKRNIKMFYFIHNPKPQDGLILKKRGGMHLKADGSSWQWLTDGSSAISGLLLCFNREIKIYTMCVILRVKEMCKWKPTDWLLDRLKG